jgi:hypothetical protein
VVERDIVFAAFNALEQVALVGDDEVGAYIQLLGQKLPKLDLEPREGVAFLVIEGRCISLKGSRQIRPGSKRMVTPLKSLSRRSDSGSLCYGCRVPSTTNGHEVVMTVRILRKNWRRK